MNTHAKGVVVGLAGLLSFPMNGIATLDSWRSEGRQPDSTSKVIREFRQAERRRIPLEVALKAASTYERHEPISVTILVTNLFEKPLLLNGRMLINHPRLQGEISFRIIGPDGQRREISRLVTPMSIHEEDFVVLPRGMSLQRTVDLADFYSLKQKGLYRIEVIYHNDVDQVVENLPAWKGAVASEPIEVTLK